MQDKIGYKAHGVGELSPPEPRAYGVCTACDGKVFDPDETLCTNCRQMNNHLKEVTDNLYELLLDTIGLRKRLERTAPNENWKCIEFRLAEKFIRLALKQARQCRIV